MSMMTPAALFAAQASVVTYHGLGTVGVFYSAAAAAPDVTFGGISRVHLAEWRIRHEAQARLRHDAEWRTRHDA